MCSRDLGTWALPLHAGYSHTHTMRVFVFSLNCRPFPASPENSQYVKEFPLMDVNKNLNINNRFTRENESDVFRSYSSSFRLTCSTGTLNDWWVSHHAVDLHWLDLSWEFLRFHPSYDLEFPCHMFKRTKTSLPAKLALSINGGCRHLGSHCFIKVPLLWIFEYNISCSV